LCIGPGALVEANLVHVGHQPLGTVAQQALLKLDCREGKQKDSQHGQSRYAENADNPLLAGHILSRHRRQVNCS
jgi:hypothetical protein